MFPISSIAATVPLPWMRRKLFGLPGSPPASLSRAPTPNVGPIPRQSPGPRSICIERNRDGGVEIEKLRVAPHVEYGRVVLVPVPDIGDPVAPLGAEAVDGPHGLTKHIAVGGILHGENGDQPPLARAVLKIQCIFHCISFPV